jgi:hypothetical protein
MGAIRGISWQNQQFGNYAVLSSGCMLITHKINEILAKKAQKVRHKVLLLAS